MKHWILITLLVSSRLAARGAIVLDQQHVDLALNFNPAVSATANPWLLTVRNEDTRHEYAGERVGHEDSRRVTMLVNEFAELEIPDEPAFAFLGAPGESTWILPQTQDPALLYAGVSTENKSAQFGWEGHGVGAEFLVRGVGQGAFLGNKVQLALKSFAGPGHFHLYVLDEFGSPVVHFDTADGLSSLDFREFSPGSHAHFNFAFSAPGDYLIGLQGGGALSDGTWTESDVTIFHFQVIPEPGAITLLALSGGAVLGGRRRGARGESLSAVRGVRPSRARG